MKTSKFSIRRFTLHDMLNSREWQSFESDKLGNDLFISEPHRASRRHDAAENGADGSTHEEHLEDQREFLTDKWCCPRLPERVKARLLAEIDACEAWHEKNGTLYKEVG